MASGAIPLVVPAGGQKEIVEDGISGYYWHSIEELEELTKRLMKSQKLREATTAGVYQRSTEFDRIELNKKTAAFFSLSEQQK